MSGGLAPLYVAPAENPPKKVHGQVDSLQSEGPSRTVVGMTNRERLQQIDDLLTEIIGTFDTSTHQCKCCTATRANNYEDHLVAARFIAVRKKYRALVKDRRSGAWLLR